MPELRQTIPCSCSLQTEKLVLVNVLLQDFPQVTFPILVEKQSSWYMAGTCANPFLCSTESFSKVRCLT